MEIRADSIRKKVEENMFVCECDLMTKFGDSVGIQRFGMDLQ